MKLRLGNWIGLAAVVVLLDQWTKHLVRGALRTGEVIPVTDFFDLVLAFNPGAAFSFTQPIIDNVTEAVTGSAADLAVIPHPSFGVNWLTHRT